MEKLIALSEFASRQTKESSFSYYDGTEEELIKLTTEHFEKNNIIEGYREGVIKVVVPSDNFYTNIVPLDETCEFETVFEPRQEGEDCFKSTHVINKEKSLAKYVEIILYHKDVLQEDNDRSKDSVYEIISINAQPCKDIPMNPITMVRNEKHLKGGTRANYSKEEYMEAILFWSQYGVVK